MKNLLPFLLSNWFRGAVLLLFSFSFNLVGVSKEFQISPDQGFGAAIKAIAEFRANNPDYQEPVVASFADGTYVLPYTIILDKSISGTEKSPTVFRAANGAKPVFSGGTIIKNWSINDQGFWSAPLPDGLTALTGSQDGKPDLSYTPEKGQLGPSDRNVTQLFVNNQRRFRPRLPKRGNGYFFVENTLPPTTAIEGNAEQNKNLRDDRFQFAQTNGTNDIPASLANLEDVEVFSVHHWNASRLPLKKIDAEKRILQTAPVENASYWARFMKGHPYFLDNVKESLGQPGDWYFDRSSNQITYVPNPGETPDNTEIVVPRLRFLLTIGTPDSPVEYVELQGLTFAFAAWSFPENGFQHAQAEVGMKAGVNFAAGSHITINQCCFRHFGAYGIHIAKGSEYNTLSNCDLVDIGAGGIQINGDHNTVIDSTIRSVGRLHPAGIGVMIGHANYNTIQNCDIYDLYYSSTSIGWTWGYAPSQANHNIVAWNHMYNIGQGLLSDMGAVYTLGISPGTRIEYNRIHDVQSFGYGGWGLYTDEGSTDIVMRGNTVFRCKSSSFHQHYGKENIIENNIMVDAKESQLQRTRSEDHCSFRFRRNIIAWHSDSAPFGSNWGADQYDIDDNLYFTPNHETVLFPTTNKSLDEWRQRGHDLRSLINVDPQFVDWSNDDYRLKPQSPAYKLGFQDLPKDNQPGRRTQSAFAAIPEVPAGFAPPKAP